ncbi:hypothetical protein [Oceanobacillus chungangensis]|uniref:Uncharacterized protein n=1 Tax=Oceanobacillus chungangensis TaxID=1229152 RepID=A0A3D8PU45_9BACI|nr:hypothetical protein [Oceanobacillus chungangensis]RDW18778.1 hypothetical protein CWR45_09290 [Oceanobacillus chungangensis]
MEDNLLSYFRRVKKGKVLLLILVIFLLPILIIHILFKIPAVNSFFESVWSAGDIISYFIAFLTFLGTLSLGTLALLQNNKLNKINKDLTQHQFKPVIAVNPFIGEIDEKERLRTYDRTVERDENGYLINHGWSLHQQHISNYKTISIKNIGLGPAVNVELFWYELDSVEGLSDLKQIKEENIDNFYDKVSYSNFTFNENGNKKNEPWMIFTEFDLGISEETNKVNLLFSFENNVKELHSIIEIRYQSILGRKIKKLLYLEYDPLFGEARIMPVSKDYIYD